ncbi:SRPBCC family protein [Aquisalinus luteolus]|nr:SRPBCC domain-containing protein [Aquisalinus luteolus]
MMTKEMTITKTLFLKASPERVWRFLTKKDLLATWFMAGGEDVVAGGDWITVTNSEGKEGQPVCTGKVKEFTPPAGGKDGRLVHTFTHKYLEGVETLCTWTLVGVEGGTILTLVHSGFEEVAENPFAMAVDHDKGWDEHFIRLRFVAG